MPDPGLADEVMRITTARARADDNARALYTIELANLVDNHRHEFVAALRSGPERVEAMREDAWRDLDDCPNDGRWIWIVGGVYDYPFRARAQGYFWRCSVAHGSKSPPTHWHPDIVLPPLPLSPEGES